MWRIRRLILLAPVCISLLFPLCAQQTVCDLFKDLAAADGRQIVVTGDLVISKNIAVLGAWDCDNHYVSHSFVHPVAVRLQPSPAVPPRKLAEFDAASARADTIRDQGKGVDASAIVTGTLKLSSDSNLAAVLTFDSIDSIRIEALPAPDELVPISICDVFQNLAAWKGKRIAVRGSTASTGEGTWLSDSCKEGLVTDGYRWPASLSYGMAGWFSAETQYLARVKPASDAPKGSESFKGRDNVIQSVTWVGRLRTKDKYQVVCRPGGDYVTFGFGHLGAAAAELVVEAILDPEFAPSPPVNLEEEDPPASCPNEVAQCTGPLSLMSAVSRNCLGLTREALTKEGIDSKGGSESDALRIAIVNGNEAITRLLLDAGAPVNPAHPRLWPPLGEAAWRHRLKIMKLLLARGADVEALDTGSGGTWLAAYGYFDPRVENILLESHANANARDAKGATALMHASTYGYEQSVKLLIDHKAEVNLVDRAGRTALMYAAAGQYVDAIPLLLSAGANPTIRDNQGKTAFDLAKDAHNEVALDLLLSLADSQR